MSLKKRIEQIERTYRAPKSYLDSLEGPYGASKELDAQFGYLLAEDFGEKPNQNHPGFQSMERERIFNKKHGIVPKKTDLPDAPEDLSELIKGL